MNFGGLPKEYSALKTSKVVIVPVPYDETSTWIKGADKGPDALIEASENMELYDIETDSEVYKQTGIFTDEPINEKSSPEKMTEAVYKKVCDYIEQKKFTIVIGGEHSVSIGTIKAHVENYKNISVLQLDAHSDLREEYHGSKFNHACVMARAREMAPIVQVGIRSTELPFTSQEKKAIFLAEEIYNNRAWIQKAVSMLSKNVYITIDLDVFDPSIVPSTGTPEPGGLLWYDVLALMKEVIKKRNVVGFDVVELCPNKASKASDFLAAKLVYKLLSYKFIK